MKVEKKREIIEKVMVCNCCKKEIKERDDYFRCTTSCRNWAEDVGDSIATYDICPECFDKFTKQFANKELCTENGIQANTKLECCDAYDTLEVEKM